MYWPDVCRLLVGSGAGMPSGVVVRGFGRVVDEACGFKGLRPHWRRVRRQVMDGVGVDSGLDACFRLPCEFFAGAFNYWTVGKLKAFTFGDREAGKLLKGCFGRAL
ncbi:hypothetical protein ABT247_23280 [Kitasatospora sp. NPDC001539]|uniref:hypothetical protein n=1 Tax=Kitasatospora sp. NPDC001539 TaxID=3154384 RepID=UPI0033325E86